MWSLDTVCPRGGSWGVGGSGDIVRPTVVPKRCGMDTSCKGKPCVSCFTTIGVDVLSLWTCEGGVVVDRHRVSEGWFVGFRWLWRPCEAHGCSKGVWD